MEIKEKLLKTNVVVDNDSLNQYCELIQKNKNTTNQDGKQKHHIIPVFYFKYNNLPIDDSEENLVYLNKEDHVLAHRLLYKCGINYFKYNNLFAMNKFGLTQEDKDEYEEFCMEHSKKTYKLNSVVIIKNGDRKKYIFNYNRNKYPGWSVEPQEEKHTIKEWSLLLETDKSNIKKILRYAPKQLKGFSWDGFWKSYIEWEKETGIRRTTLESRYKKGKNPFEKIKTTTFEERINDNSPVLCVEMNEKYSSVKACADFWGFSLKNFKRHIDNGTTYGGFHWVII